MASKLLKVETPEECLRLWKAGLVVNKYKKPWFPCTKYQSSKLLQEASVCLYDAYVLVESEDDNQ